MNLGTELDGIADTCHEEIRDIIESWVETWTHGEVTIPEDVCDELSASLYRALETARDDGFEAGEEAGRISGQEQAERDIEENIAYELRDCIAGDPWNHRAREAGLDARAVSLPADILGAMTLPVDDVTLTMPEHEAYRLLALVRDAARLAGV